MSREEQVIDAQQKARQEIEDRKQQQFEEEQARHRRQMDSLELQIAPLKLSKVKGSEDDPNWGYMNRTVLSEAGENLGRIVYKRSGYYRSSPMKFTLTSSRIPATRGYRSEGSRIYKKFDSVVAAIKKFCIPVSTDEERAEVLRKELRRYREVVSQSYRRSLSVDGNRWSNSAPVSGFVQLLASDIKQDQIEGAEYMRVLIRKCRVHKRFDKWVKETFIDPRQTELNSLDTSKETIR